MPESKNALKCIIRNVNLEDAETILEIQSSVVSEGDYFISVSEELEGTPLQKQRERIQGRLGNEREAQFVAEVNGVVVGWVVFRSNKSKRMSHTGSISMAISKEYRGMGIGKLLLKKLLDWAEKNPFIEKVSLGVFSTNVRAISLYKKMGFLEEGRKVKEFKLSDGVYIDDILMYKFV